MIYENDKQITVVLGEGDIALGVSLGDGIPYGISIQQLNGKHEIGSDLGTDDIKDGVKQINIIFANKGGVESLVRALERFAKSVNDKRAEEGEVNCLLDKTLEELDVTVRSYNCLKRAGINSVGDLVKMSEDDLCHIRNMGRRCVEEIVKKLKGLGLELRREETEDESKTTPKV